MIDAIACDVPGEAAIAAEGLGLPALTDRSADAFCERGRIFDPLLKQPSAPTIVGGGGEVHVIPTRSRWSSMRTAARLRSRKLFAAAAPPLSGSRGSSRSAARRPDSPPRPDLAC